MATDAINRILALEADRDELKAQTRQLQDANAALATQFGNLTLMVNETLIPRIESIEAEIEQHTTIVKEVHNAHTNIMDTMAVDVKTEVGKAINIAVSDNAFLKATEEQIKSIVRQEFIDVAQDIHVTKSGLQAQMNACKASQDRVMLRVSDVELKVIANGSTGDRTPPPDTPQTIRNPITMEQIRETLTPSQGDIAMSMQPLGMQMAHKRMMNEEESDGLRRDGEAAYFLNPRDQLHLFGIKTASCTKLTDTDHDQWKTAFEGQMRNVLTDGSLLNIMMGWNKYNTPSLQTKAEEKIYDMLIIAIHPYIKLSRIDPEIRAAKNGRKLAMFVYEYLEDFSKDKRKLLLKDFHQDDERFKDKDSIIAAMEDKLQLADEANGLTLPHERHFTEQEICETIIAFLPLTEFWQHAKDVFDAMEPAKLRRTVMLTKVSQRIKLLNGNHGKKPKSNVFGAQVNVTELCNAATWRKPFSNGHGRNKTGYRDPEKLHGYNGPMNEKVKIAKLIEFLGTLDKAPHLDTKDYRAFMQFATANHVTAEMADSIIAEFKEEDAANYHAAMDDDKSIDDNSSDDDDVAEVALDDDWNESAFFLSLNLKPEDAYGFFCQAERWYEKDQVKYDAMSMKILKEKATYGDMGAIWKLKHEL